VTHRKIELRNPADGPEYGSCAPNDGGRISGSRGPPDRGRQVPRVLLESSETMLIRARDVFIERAASHRFPDRARRLQSMIRRAAKWWRPSCSQIDAPIVARRAWHLGGSRTRLLRVGADRSAAVGRDQERNARRRKASSVRSCAFR